MHLAASPLSAWGTFYQIVGSSAGALTGLQFGAAVLLLITGIHNAWDAAACIALASAVEKGAGTGNDARRTDSAPDARSR